MAPARKRGGKGVKTTSELSLGDLVLAKVKGFPAWPAKISNPEDWDRAPDPKKYFVQFFGTEEIAFVVPADVQAFTIEVKNKLSARCLGKTVKYFAQAVRDICEEFEELQRKDSSVSGDEEVYRASLERVDAAVLEQMDRDEMSMHEANTKSLVDGSGLERCSMVNNGLEDNLSPSIKTDSVPSRTSNSVQELAESTHDGQSEDWVDLKENLRTAEKIPDFLPSTSCDDVKLLLDSSQKQLINGHKAVLAKRKHVGGSEVLRIGGTSGDPTVKKGSVKKLLPEAKSGSIVRKKVNRPKDRKPDLVDAGVDISEEKKFQLSSKKLKVEPGQISRRIETADPLKKKFAEGGGAIDASLVVGSSKNFDTGEVVKSELKKSTTPMRKAEDRTVGSNNSGGAIDVPLVIRSSKSFDEAKVVKSELKKSTTPVLKAEDRTNNSGGAIDAPLVIRSSKSFDEAKVVKSELKKSTTPVRKAEDRTNNSGGAIDASLMFRSSKNFDEAKVVKSELKKSTTPVRKAEESIIGSNISGEEDILPPSMRHRRAMESISGSSVPQQPTKRRAVRLFEDDVNELPKTPVHGGGFTKRDAISRVPNSVKKLGLSEAVSRVPNSVKKPGQSDAFSCVLSSVKKLESSDAVTRVPNALKKPDLSTGTTSDDQIGVRDSVMSEDRGIKEHAPSFRLQKEPSVVRVSQKNMEKKPIPTDASVSCSSGILGTPKTDNFPHSKSPGSAVKLLLEPQRGAKLPVKPHGDHRKLVAESNTGSFAGSGNLDLSHDQPINDRSKMASTGERRTLMSEPALVPGNPVESIFARTERSEGVKDEKHYPLVDSKVVDHETSMKHLIAAAQARRRQAHSQNIHGNNTLAALAHYTEQQGGSPNPPEVQVLYPRSSPTSEIRQISSANPPELEENEEKRVSSGQRPSGGPLSGGTEAAVARDSFEGMIETLSRTKESIGRATRLAVDIAKYGIANEVVELLIRKLENEPNLHRRVDLFFLVDSITQCSHSHKGIAGASYIPAVQAALPRLLGAAAPSGVGARENRRQCLKVLRLWLERKIYPDSLLRRHMDDIVAVNDDSSVGLCFRRPSRAERAVDDPIREMEDMLVDEYGSNATFQLPGFLSSHVFEEEEEDALHNLQKDNAEELAVEHTPVTDNNSEKYTSVTPSDRRHCILEDVDGELEMEDETMELTLDDNYDNNLSDLSPLPMGSPPLPPSPPPCTPPLPDSPPPSPVPPPPPSSPLPPPPPPPPPHTLSQPPPPPFPVLPTGPPPLMFPQPSFPTVPSATPVVPFPQPPLPNDVGSMPSGHRLPQMAGNMPRGPRMDVSIRNEVFPVQLPPSFTPVGVTNSRPSEYGYNAPFPPRPPVHLNPPHQIPSNSFSYSRPPVQQQRPQQPYPAPPPDHPDGSRRYVGDAQWRVQSNEFNGEHLRGMWIGAGRPPFSQEGYFRPPDRPTVNNVGFQPSGSNVFPMGPPISGHAIPSRPDITSLNWRPA